MKLSYHATSWTPSSLVNLSQRLFTVIRVYMLVRGHITLLPPRSANHIFPIQRYVIIYYLSHLFSFVFTPFCIYLPPFDFLFFGSLSYFCLSHFPCFSLFSFHQPRLGGGWGCISNKQYTPCCNSSSDALRHLKQNAAPGKSSPIAEARLPAMRIYL